MFDDLLALSLPEIIAEGKRVREEEQRLIDADLAAAFRIRIPLATTPDASVSDGNVTCLAVITSHPELRSQLGNQLAAVSDKRGLAPMAALAYIEPGMGPETAEGVYKVSLRSLGDFDTTTISKPRGGGGHRNASSCNVPKSEFLSWKVEDV